MDLCYEAEEILLGYEARRIEDDIDTYLAICSSKYGETEFTGLEGYHLGCITGRTKVYSQDVKTWSAALEDAEGNIFQRAIAWIKKMFENFWNWLKGLFGGNNSDPTKAKPNKMMSAIKSKAASTVAQLKSCKEKNIVVKADLSGLWTIDMLKACKKLDSWNKEAEALTMKIQPEVDKLLARREEIKANVAGKKKEELNKEITEIRKQLEALDAQTDDTNISKFMKASKDDATLAKLFSVSTPAYKGEITIGEEFIKFFEELDTVFPISFLTGGVKCTQTVMQFGKKVEEKITKDGETLYKKAPSMAKLDMAIAKGVIDIARGNAQAMMHVLRKLMALVSKVSAAANKALGTEKKDNKSVKEPAATPTGNKKKGKGGKESYMPAFRSTRLQRLGGTA